MDVNYDEIIEEGVYIELPIDDARPPTFKGSPRYEVPIRCHPVWSRSPIRNTAWLPKK